MDREEPEYPFAFDIRSEQETIPPLVVESGPSRRRPRRKFGVLAVVGVILGSLWICGGLSRLANRTHREFSQIGGSQLELPPTEVWNSEAPPVSPETQEAVERLFTEVATAMRQSDTQSLGACIDFPRMIRESLAQDGQGDLATRNISRLIQATKNDLPDRLMDGWTAEAFENCTVQRCVGSVGGTEICVYVRHQSKPAGREKIRWWLARTGERWRIYDFEDLKFGIRLSSEMAEGMKLGFQQMAEGRNVLQDSLANMRRVQAAQMAIRVDDYETCERTLQQVRIADLTDGMKLMALVLQAAVDAERNRPHQVLENLEQAERYREDAPLILLMRAMAQNDLGEFYQARQAAAAYVDQVGDDADGYHELGRAYVGLDEGDKATEAFRQALKDDPNYVESLLMLGLILQLDEIGEVRRRFHQLDDPASSFPWLCENYLQGGRYDAFQTVFNAHFKGAAKNPECKYYVALSAEDWPEMIRLYEEEIEESPLLDPASAYRPTLALAFYEQGRAMDALERFQPLGDVYHQLAGLAADAEDKELLAQLNDRYAREVTGNPRLALWQAETYWLEQDYEQTVSLLAEGRKGLVLFPDAEERLADRLIRSLVHLQQFDDAATEGAMWQQKYGDPLYSTLVSAARGDVDQTLDGLKKCVDAGYEPALFYLDPLLGPALRQKGFEKVRKAYPDPEKRRVYGPTEA